MSRWTEEKMEFDEIRLDEITGIVLEPNIEDSYGHTIDAQEVAEACLLWNEKWQHLTIQHRDRNGRLIDLEELADVDTFKDCWDSDFEVLSSFCTSSPGSLDGKSISEGSWLLSLKVKNPSIWELIKEKQLTGYSIGALGIKNFNGAVRLTNVLAPEVSIVEKPANQRSFLQIKN